MADELPYNYQAMLFWAGLRGAVGVALAAGLSGENAFALKATVLVVVVLTVIIFGGTTARMLEILGIKTGVIEEIDSDDEFDIEAVSGGSYYKRNATGIGHQPKRSIGSMPLEGYGNDSNGYDDRHGSAASYASGNASPRVRPSSLNRKSSSASQRGRYDSADLLGRNISGDESDIESDTSDLPPAAKRSPKRRPEANENTPYPTSGTTDHPNAPHISASGAISSLIHGTAEDHAAWFKQLDEGFIKPHLLLDGHGSRNNGGPSGGV